MATAPQLDAWAPSLVPGSRTVHHPRPPDIVTLLGIVDLQLRGTWPVAKRADKTAKSGWRQELNPGPSPERKQRDAELQGRPGARPWTKDLPALSSPPKGSALIRDGAGAQHQARSLGTLAALDAQETKNHWKKLTRSAEPPTTPTRWRPQSRAAALPAAPAAASPPPAESSAADESVGTVAGIVGPPAPVPTPKQPALWEFPEGGMVRPPTGQLTLRSSASTPSLPPRSPVSTAAGRWLTQKAVSGQADAQHGPRCGGPQRPVSSAATYGDSRPAPLSRASTSHSLLRQAPRLLASAAPSRGSTPLSLAGSRGSSQSDHHPLLRAHACSPPARWGGGFRSGSGPHTRPAIAPTRLWSAV